MTIDCNQFNNNLCVLFGIFFLKKQNVCKRSNIQKKTKRNLVNSFSLTNFDIEILKNMFFFIYFKQKRDETKFFEWGKKKTKRSSTKKRNIDIPTNEPVHFLGFFTSWMRIRFRNTALKCLQQMLEKVEYCRKKTWTVHK